MTADSSLIGTSKQEWCAREVVVSLDAKGPCDAEVLLGRAQEALSNEIGGQRGHVNVVLNAGDLSYAHLGHGEGLRAAVLYGDFLHVTVRGHTRRHVASGKTPPLENMVVSVIPFSGALSLEVNGEAVWTRSEPELEG